MAEFDDLPYISCLSFFDITIPCHYVSSDKEKEWRDNNKYDLPSFAEYNDEKKIVDVRMGWNNNNLLFSFTVKKDSKISPLEDVNNGDSIEIFIDTRNRKNNRFITSFCHHFIFSPKDMAGKEITRFRGDDMHSICDPKYLRYHVDTNYKLAFIHNISIPRECLYGYDPLQYNHFGFTYRVTSSEGKVQHFNVVEKEFSVEQNPSLWCSMIITK
jgi:hypothetical protein